MTWMDALPVTTVTLELELAGDWTSDRPGVAFRGALLAALMAVSCIGERGACSPRCGCAMASFWRPLDARPVQWWLRPSVLDGRRWVVGLGFVGELPDPIVLAAALKRMERAGLGPERVPFRLKRAWVEGRHGEVLWLDDGRWAAAWPAPAVLGALVRPALTGEVAVHLETPFLSRSEPTAAEWIQRAIGRVRGLARSLDRRLEVRWPSPAGALGQTALERRTGGRRPKSQGGRQDLSGYVGTLSFTTAEMLPYEDLLRASEIIGVGRSTVLGMGAVSLEEGTW